MTARKRFDVTEKSLLEFSVQTERFLGGHAEIGLDEVSFGEVRLEGSEWSHRFNVSSKTDIGENETMHISTRLYLPNSARSEASVNIRYRLAF